MVVKRKTIGYYISRDKCVKAFKLQNPKTKKYSGKRVSESGRKLKEGTRVFKTKALCKEYLNKKQRSKTKKVDKKVVKNKSKMNKFGKWYDPRTFFKKSESDYDQLSYLEQLLLSQYIYNTLMYYLQRPTRSIGSSQINFPDPLDAGGAIGPSSNTKKPELSFKEQVALYKNISKKLEKRGLLKQNKFGEWYDPRTWFVNDDNNDDKSVTLDKLPDDVKLELINKLQSCNDVTRLCNTSKEMRKLCKDNNIYQNYALKHMDLEGITNSTDFAKECYFKKNVIKSITFMADKISGDINGEEINIPGKATLIFEKYNDNNYRLRINKKVYNLKPNLASISFFDLMFRAIPNAEIGVPLNFEYGDIINLNYTLIKIIK